MFLLSFQEKEKQKVQCAKFCVCFFHLFYQLIALLFSICCHKAMFAHQCSRRLRSWSGLSGSLSPRRRRRAAALPPLHAVAVAVVCARSRNPTTSCRPHTVVQRAHRMSRDRISFLKYFSYGLRLFWKLGFEAALPVTLSSILHSNTHLLSSQCTVPPSSMWESMW